MGDFISQTNEKAHRMPSIRNVGTGLEIGLSGRLIGNFSRKVKIAIRKGESGLAKFFRLCSRIFERPLPSHTSR